MLRMPRLQVLCLIALCVSPTMAGTIELRPSVHIDAERIVLETVAQIEVAGEQAEVIAQVDLGPAPQPGGSRRLTAGYIKMRLRGSGVDCRALSFEGAETVSVHRVPLATSTASGSTNSSDDLCHLGAEHQPAPVEVRRGARLHLIVTRGPVVIGAEAVLLEDTVVGGRARVRVLQTRETVTVRMIGETEAVISGDEVDSCAY